MSKLSPRAKRRLRTTGTHVLMIAVSAVILFPLFIAITSSLKGQEQIFSYPYVWLPWPLHFENYKEAFRLVPLGRFLWNSTVQSTMTTVAVLVTSALAAYAFAYLEFPFKRLVFGVILATMMVTGEVTIIPNYMTIHTLGWTDTYLGLTVPFFATGFGIFLLRQFFLQIPRELYDAAVIDGCSRLRYLFTVVLPLSRPAMGTLAVYNFLSTWNQYFWPLIVTNRPLMRTVQIGIAMLRDEEGDHWHVIMAGVVVVTAPAIILFVLFQKQLVRGMTSGAIKG